MSHPELALADTDWTSMLWATMPAGPGLRVPLEIACALHLALQEREELGCPCLQGRHSETVGQAAWNKGCVKGSGLWGALISKSVPLGDPHPTPSAPGPGHRCQRGWA